MEHGREELDRFGETIVAILDPDFIFLKPLTQSGTDPKEIIVTEGQGTDPGANQPVDHAKKGRPVAQRYGLGAGWKSRFHVEDITLDPDSPAITMSEQEAARTTSVGPPLILHVDDISRLSMYWAAYMLRVLAQEKDILADMWAYSIGAAHLGLKHTMVDMYMVSSPTTYSGEGFEFVDRWSNLSCEKPLPKVGERYPVAIRMAQNFKAPDIDHGPHMFHKGHVPAEILECDTPLLKLPPDDLWRVSEGAPTKRAAWLVCHIHARINEAVLDYKKSFCPTGFEQRKLVKLIRGKPQDHKCTAGSKWCFPLAQIEGLSLE